MINQENLEEILELSYYLKDNLSIKQYGGTNTYRLS